MTLPVAATISTLSDLIEFSVKQSTLHGAKTIGQMAVATAGMSLLIKRMNFSFSVDEPGLVSALSTGYNVILRKPQWNSIRVFDGIGSLFSVVLFSLKCMVDSLVSWGNRVERITAWSMVKSELSPLSFGISRTIVM